jgi:16S rRNA (uracil1498-N3)-methyltransferase
MRAMKPAPRLYLDDGLDEGSEHELAPAQAHYLRDVLRLGPGDPVHVFNARDGEYLAFLTEAGRKHVILRCEKKRADVSPPPDIDFLFAPLKHARLDYIVQKATELGARRLVPVITARTIASKVNIDRMRANAVEAAEQCNLVFVPEVLEPQKLEVVLAAWPTDRALVFCDEAADGENPLAALAKLKPPAALLIGPEGGFTDEERDHLRRLSFVTAISLGPRIMRADTAGTAALALLQAAIGDWGKSIHHNL